MGRKKISIDWDKVDRYLQAQCSAVGIASILGIHERTLYGRCETDKNMLFTDYAQQKRGEGQELIRMKQFKLAMEEDKIMLIWLGKQYLGQSDRTDHTSKGEQIQPINVNVTKPEQSEKYKQFIQKIGQLN